MIRFTWNNDIDCPLLVFIVCSEKLNNEAMVSRKLKRHLTTKHLGETLKVYIYFECLLNSNKIAASYIIKRVTISDKALKRLLKLQN